MEKFQKDNDLKVNGEVKPNTFTKLVA